MDLRLKDYMIHSTDISQAINRRGNELLDPTRHGHVESAESPWAPSRCARCGRPADEHWSMIHRLIVRLVRWGR